MADMHQRFTIDPTPMAGIEERSASMEAARLQNTGYLNAFRQQIFLTSDIGLLIERKKRALAIAQQPTTDHAGLINYLSVAFFGSEPEPALRLPPEIDLFKMKGIFNDLLEGQKQTDREQGRSGYLDWKSMRLRLPPAIVGEKRSIFRDGADSSLKNGEFPSLFLHSHPTENEFGRSYSLHFSGPDFFTFECNIFGAAAVVCEAGALLFVKPGGAVATRTASEVIGMIKETQKEIEAKNLDAGPMIRAFTGKMAKRFGHQMYRIRDLSEMVAREVEL